jgi:hypothetical protein
MRKTQGGSIEVSVRVRPQLRGGGGAGDAHAVPASVRAFAYPTAVIVGSNQQTAFDAVGAPLMRRMREGYNTTLLAYGQTGSGKTYTVFGPTGSLSEASLGGSAGGSAGGAPPQWGVFPRIALAMISSSGNLKASAIEIYNNQPFDLLNERAPLKMSRASNATFVTHRVTSKRGPDEGATGTNQKVGLNGEHPPSCTCHDCFKAKERAKAERKKRIAAVRAGAKAGKSRSAPMLAKSGGGGGGARTVGETLWDLNTPTDVARFARQIEMSRVAHGHALNARSSRSHCLVRLQSASVSGGSLMQQCFTFVDLAGSERTGKSGVEGQRMSEAIGINNSLTVLGRCIRAVGRGKSHVPWRDATLCQLLRVSFEGKGATHTAVVVNVSPEHEEETLCTLRFGENVAGVTNEATRVVGQNANSQIAVLRSTIMELKAKQRKMKKDGQAPGFVPGCINSEKLSLQKNMDKLAAISERVANLKVRLVETGGDPRVAERLAAAKKEEDVLSAITWRQQTIKALWNPGTPMYKSLMAELGGAENSLRMMETGAGRGRRK